MTAGTTSTTLDRALELAHHVATRLCETDAHATAAYRAAVRRLAGSPLALRQLREERISAADRMLATLGPELDEAWAELGALDEGFNTRHRAIATAAWRAAVLPYFLRTPLCRRSLDKPLGYPGDYGMVQLVYAEPEDESDPLGLALARYVWGTGPCRAHRQRRPWSIQHLAEARLAAGRPLRVLSYACGPEHTLRAWVAEAPDTVVHLYDTEARALQWCRDRFKEQGHRAPVHAHLLQPGELSDGSADVLHAAPADVALVLGLFDYLSPELVGALVDRLVSVLAPGGRLLCTNLHGPNPWRAMMEYMGAWQVQHRGLDDLVALVVRDRTDLRVIDARLDDSRTNAFVAVERRAGL